VGGTVSLGVTAIFFVNPTTLPLVKVVEIVTEKFFIAFEGGYNLVNDKVDVALALAPVSPLPKSKAQEAAGGGMALTITSSNPQLSQLSPSLSGWYHLKIVEACLGS
jgi:hypothetical protein